MSQRSKLMTALLISMCLLASVTAAAPQQTERQPTQRLVGVTAAGDMITLRLNDGSSIDVPLETVIVTDARREDTSQPRLSTRVASADRADRRPARLNLQQLIASAGTLPAVVKFRYGADGEVRRARIIVFRAEENADAFVRRTNGARGAAGAPTQ